MKLPSLLASPTAIDRLRRMDSDRVPEFTRAVAKFQAALEGVARDDLVTLSEGVDVLAPLVKDAVEAGPLKDDLVAVLREGVSALKGAPGLQDTFGVLSRFERALADGNHARMATDLRSGGGFQHLGARQASANMGWDALDREARHDSRAWDLLSSRFGD